MDKREGGLSEESVELSQEPPVDITRDPRPQDALQVVPEPLLAQRLCWVLSTLTGAGCMHAPAVVTLIFSLTLLKQNSPASPSGRNPSLFSPAFSWVLGPLFALLNKHAFLLFKSCSAKVN